MKKNTNQQKTRKKEGMPRATTEELLAAQKQAFLEAMLKPNVSGVIMAACKAIKKSRYQIYEWMNADPDFKEAVAQTKILASEQIGDIAETALIERLKAGDTTAIIFTLKNKKNQEYGKGEGDTYIDNRKIVLNSPKALETVMKSVYALMETVDMQQHGESADVSQTVDRLDDSD